MERGEELGRERGRRGRGIQGAVRRPSRRGGNKERVRERQGAVEGRLAVIFRKQSGDTSLR